MGICCMAHENQAGALYQPRGMAAKGDEREFQKREDMCIPMSDSC